MNKKKKIIVFGLIIVILLIVILVVISRKSSDNTKKKDVTTHAIKNDSWNSSSGSASLIKVYLAKDGNTIVTCKEGIEDVYANDSDYKFINSYRCYLSGCEAYGSSLENSYVVIKDDGYVIYDYAKEVFKKTNLPNANYKSIEFLTYDGKTYGLSVSNIHERYAFYDLETEQFKTEFKYTNIFSGESPCLSKGYFTAALVVNDIPKYYLVGYKNGKVIKESDVFMGSVGNGKHVYYYENYGEINGYDVVFYNDELKKVFEDRTYSTFGVSKMGNLALKNEDESFSIYTKNGTFVKKSKPYKQILMILNDYVVVKDNDEFLKIVDYDGNVEAKFVCLTDYKMLDLDYSGIIKTKAEKSVYLRVLDLKENVDTIYYYNLDNKESGIVKTFD